jgi:hypothetical protein
VVASISETNDSICSPTEVRSEIIVAICVDAADICSVEDDVFSTDSNSVCIFARTCSLEPWSSVARPAHSSVLRLTCSAVRNTSSIP